MQVETDEPEVIERVAALDVGKAEVVCCARVPGPGGQRMQEVRTVSTMTAALLALGDWLASLGVSRVVMEATSDYWRAPFYLLEDRFETWLVNAHDVKHVPGRPKTELSSLGDRPCRPSTACALARSVQQVTSSGGALWLKGASPCSYRSFKDAHPTRLASGRRWIAGCRTCPPGPLGGWAAPPA